MSDYIDIDAPIDFAVYERNRRIQATLRQILESNDAKYERADVRSVVRGEWKDAMQGCHDSPHVKCSVCGEYYWQYFKKFNFCPNCGADMRGNR